MQVTTTDGPVIRQWPAKNAGNVFATDAILALLMVCPRSSYPWDIVVQKVGDKLFFDKRDNSPFGTLPSVVAICTHTFARLVCR